MQNPNCVWNSVLIKMNLDFNFKDFAQLHWRSLNYCTILFHALRYPWLIEFNIYSLMECSIQMPQNKLCYLEQVSRDLTRSLKEFSVDSRIIQNLIAQKHGGNSQCDIFNSQLFSFEINI